MFRFTDRLKVSLIGLALLAPVSMAQTIGDYSRAQRALIDVTMARANTSPPASATPLPSLPAVPPPPSPRTAVTPPARTVEPEPDIIVSGVIVGKRRTAEVQVDGVPFLLEVGERVAETRWTVSSIEADRVVLTQTGTARRPARRTFLLAATER